MCELSHSSSIISLTLIFLYKTLFCTVNSLVHWWLISYIRLICFVTSLPPVIDYEMYYEALLGALQILQQSLSTMWKARQPHFPFLAFITNNKSSRLPAPNLGSSPRLFRLSILLLFSYFQQTRHYPHTQRLHLRPCSPVNSTHSTASVTKPAHK